MARPEAYRRRIFRRFGSPEVFEWESVRGRAPSATEAVVQVRFIGVNFADAIARRGYYKWAGAPPICPGFEFSGEVVEPGASTNLEPGTRVMGISKFGAYSEVLVVDESRLRPIPDGMSLEKAAALPAVYATAYHSLMEIMRIRPGEDILIQAVAGGVGTAALQIAKHVGLTTYGTASTEAKLEFARSHGLDHGINYKEHDFEEEIARLTDNRGVRFVLDSLGGAGLKKGMRCLRPMGHAVTIGAAQIVPPDRSDWTNVSEWTRIVSDFVRGGVYHPFPLIEQNQGLSGVQILLLWDALDHLNGVFDALIALHQQGAIDPIVQTVFPLEAAGEAHRFIEGRKSMGKILLAA